MRLVEDLAVGLELEFEGVSAARSAKILGLNGLTNTWDVHTDNSLRPRDRNTEFVFRGPLRDDHIELAVRGLGPIMGKEDYTLSWRCGMHVHIDHRKATHGDIIKEVTLACLMDRVWYGWGNSGRHESKFCVPLSHVWSDMVSLGETRGGYAPVLQKNSKLRAFKYTGLNVSRAYPPDIGTVEYRYAPGTKDPEEIMEFIGMAQWASAACHQFKTGMEIVESFVAEGTYENWLARYMPPDTQVAWQRGVVNMLGPQYPSSLELEAACGFAGRMGEDADKPLFRGGEPRIQLGELQEMMEEMARRAEQEQEQEQEREMEEEEMEEEEEIQF